MPSKAQIQNIISLLNANYGTDRICYLNHDNAWQLLVATILSAQCTDERVNHVTERLFKKYKTPTDFANADINELEKDIYSTGFYRNKAKNIKACAGAVLEKYEGEVPSEISQLTSLPGVGRKTANVIRGNIYGIPSIVVDTHVARISKKLGLTLSGDPEKIEKDLERVLPKESWILWNIQIIAHGRAICKARKPACGECFLRKLCSGCSN